jgi:hypothetical protein
MRAKPISVRFIGLNTKREAREGVTLKAHIYYIHQTEKCKVGYLIIIYSSMQNNKHLKQIYETAPNNTHGFFISPPHDSSKPNQNPKLTLTVILSTTEA